MSRSRGYAVVVAALAAAAANVRANEPLPARASEPEKSASEIDLVAKPPSPEARLEEIRARVQAAVVYPQAARERGIEGVARIQFRVAPNGRAAEIATVATSGSQLLDTAAEAAARDARALPPLYGWVRIPVRFELHARDVRD